MDWKRANSTLYHSSTGERMDTKNVGHRTQLRRRPETFPDDIGLFVYNNGPVIIWHRNGNLTLDNKGFWGRVTKDRLKEFLPRGFYVTQDRPYWFLHTPTGPRPWRNGMEVTKEGIDINLPEPMQSYDACALRREVEDFSRELVDALLRGSLPMAATISCSTCLSEATGEGYELDALHAFNHVRRRMLAAQTAGLLLAAITRSDRQADGMWRKTDGGGYIPRQELRDVVSLCGSPGYALLRRPRTKKELIHQTELRMTLPDHQLPRDKKHPRAYAWNFRNILSDYLLRNLGFVRME